MHPPSPEPPGLRNPNLASGYHHSPHAHNGTEKPYPSTTRFTTTHGVTQVSVSTTSEDAAVAKVQAVMRGKKDRKSVQEQIDAAPMYHHVLSTNELDNMLSKYGSLEGKDGTPRRISTVGEDNAAVKVQAALRGKKDRKSIVAAKRRGGLFSLAMGCLAVAIFSWLTPLIKELTNGGPLTPPWVKPALPPPPPACKKGWGKKC